MNFRVVSALVVGDLTGEAVSRVPRTAFLIFSVVSLPADPGVGFSLCDVDRPVFFGNCPPVRCDHGNARLEWSEDGPPIPFSRLTRLFSEGRQEVTHFFEVARNDSG